MKQSDDQELHRPDTSKNGQMKKYPQENMDEERKQRMSHILSKFKSADQKEEDRK